MAMEFARYLPSGLRMRVEGAWHNAKMLRRSVRQSFRPTFRSRHTAEELLGLTREWAERRVGEAGKERGIRSLRAEVWTADVCEVRHDTPATITLVCRHEQGHRRPFVAGQFLTLLVSIDGQERRRAYSFCSDPREPSTFALTIKRIEGGVVSNWLHAQAEDYLRAPTKDWKLRVLGPSGRFGSTLPGPDTRQVVMIAGGVGSTPLLSMAYEQLYRAPETRLTFVYANRTSQDILFREALHSLCVSYPSMQLHHILEDATDTPEVLSAQETFGAGRLEGPALARWLPADPGAHYFVCGPTGLMDNVRGHLEAGGVPASQIAQEAFVDQSGAQMAGATGAIYQLRRQGDAREIQINDRQTILDAGLAAGWPMGHSCQMGGCAACRVKLLEGHVVMEEPHCLTQEERDAGYCLACIAHPRSPIAIDF